MTREHGPDPLASGPSDGSARESDTAAEASDASDAAQEPESGLPTAVVGIGASAGGFSAVRELLRHLPGDSGAAFVVVQHLAPDGGSLAPDLLRKNTSLRLRSAEHGTSLQPDEVVFTPPAVCPRLQSGVLLLEKEERLRVTRSAIDGFFRSLAEDLGPAAVGVLLSGAGSDGTLGLKAIQDEGGVTLVQDPATAEFSGMPASAVRAGAADHVAPLAELAARLADLVAGRRPSSRAASGVTAQAPDELLSRVISLLRRHSGHDFRSYKRGTLVRRLRRRMHLSGTPDLETYLEELDRAKEEVDALFRDLMTGVTEFFRDGELLDVLTERVLQDLLARRGEEDQVRVWVPGCATGEEAYSLSILLREQSARLGSRPTITIFATDIDEQGLAFAREGLYPDGIADSVAPERLGRFFRREDHHYRVVEEIREPCIFAPHDLLRDPPFSRLDLISCRNLLIYLEPEAQERALRAFQYALEPGGCLVLGASENLASHRELFAAVDKKRRIFRRTEVAGPPPLGMLDEAPLRRRLHYALPQRPGAGRATPDVHRTVERALLQHYGPAALLVDDRRQVVHFFGRTARYFEPSAAGSGANVVDMAHPDLRHVLHAALREAERDRVEVTKQDLRVRTETGLDLVDLTVRHATEIDRESPLLLVVVRGMRLPEPEAGEAGKSGAEGPASPAAKAAPEREQAQLARELEEELRDTRERLQATIEELESSNEELQSANEELLSMNEELQTSKEEAQSINEELKTVNDELKRKVMELDRTHSDLQNLFRSTEIATIFLDKLRRIQRFTPTITELFRLREADVGRPLDDISHRFVNGDLESHVRDVLDTLIPRQLEVETPETGHWYTLRISPYRTPEDVIEGVVLTFTNITELKRTEARLREERYAKSIIETVREPLLVLDADLRVVSASRAFYETFRARPDTTRGVSFFRLLDGQWDVPELRTRLERVLPEEETIEDLELESELSALGRRILRFDARNVRSVGDEAERLLVTLEDVTEFRARERAREEEARRKDWFLAMLGHELRNPLAPLRNCVRLAREEGLELDHERRERLFGIMERQVSHLTRIVDDLVDLSRITQGKLPLSRQRQDLGELVAEAVEDHGRALEEKGLSVTLELPEGALWADVDASRLAQAVGNLLDNARKYTEPGGLVTVRLRTAGADSMAEGADPMAEIEVDDNGVGIEPMVLEHVFEPFQQGPRGPGHEDQGLGVGLTLVRTVAEAHDGEVEARSDGPGQGATFLIRLPLLEAGGGNRDGAAAAERSGTGAEGDGAAGAVARTPRPSGSGREPLRILLVEDVEETAETTRMLLELEGHEVRSVSSGPAALEVLQTFRPHFVLCDLGLPEGMSGYDVARAIRSDPEFSAVRLVALTGYSEESDRARAAAAGFDGFLVKPVAAEHLRTALDDLAPREA